MSKNIEGKVVVITGASSGLGEATARLLSAQGASVVLGMEKTAIWELEKHSTTHGGRPVRKNVFFASTRGSCWSKPASLSRWGNHLLARLVHQGSDPTLPYQALVIRESARLFLGFTPWGR